MAQRIGQDDLSSPKGSDAHDQLSSRSGGTQLVWERIFQRTMEQADVYRQSAYDTLCHVSRRLGVEGRSNGAVGSLIVVHETLVEERDHLTHMFGETQLGQLTAEFVEKASCYKTKVKAFYMNVQQVLEDSDVSSPTREASPLSSYKFPVPSMENINEARKQSIEHSGSSNQGYSLAQDNFAYSALGLYNLEPPAQRFGGATSIIHDEPTELALSVLSKFDLGTNDALTQDTLYDDLQEMTSNFTESDQVGPQVAVRQVQGNSRYIEQRGHSMGDTLPPSSLRTSCMTGLAPLRLRTFPFRTHDVLDDGPGITTEPRDLGNYPHKGM